MKFTKFVPFGKRTVLRLDTPEEVTQGGIIIPDSAQRPSTTAVVISIGSSCEKARVGTHVLIPEDAGSEIMINDEKFLLLMEDMIDGELD